MGSWLTNWDEAKRHPWRTRAVALVGFGFVGVVLILRMGRNLAWPSWIGIVLGFVLLGVAMFEGAMRQTELERKINAGRALRALGIQALVLGCGIGIALAFHSLGVLIGAMVAVSVVGVAVWTRRREKS
jgi:hypothetical protein